MKYAIASVAFFEGIGFTTTYWRKSADGTKCVTHLDTAQVLSNNLEANPQVTIYDGTDVAFKNLMASTAWKGSGFTTVPDTNELLSRQTEFETMMNGSVANFKTEVNDKIASGEYLVAVGPQGKSAYQSAVDSGFTGTEAEWIAHMEGSGDLSYVHNQVQAAATWTITHNLNKYPAVVVVDSGGSQVGGDISYPSLNVVVVSFSSGFSGKAYLN